MTRGYRLPTEAEWEYAGRYGPSGQSYRFAWGDSPPVPLGVGNLAGGETGSSLPATLPGYRDDYPVVSPVGKFHPTALGLHDMSGNVWEWEDSCAASSGASDSCRWRGMRSGSTAAGRRYGARRRRGRVTRW